MKKEIEALVAINDIGDFYTEEHIPGDKNSTIRIPKICSHPWDACKVFPGKYNKEAFEHPKTPSHYFGCGNDFDFTGWRTVKVKFVIDSEITKTQSEIEIKKKEKENFLERFIIDHCTMKMYNEERETAKKALKKLEKKK